MNDPITGLLPLAVATLVYAGYHIYLTRDLKGAARRDVLVPRLLMAAIGFGAVMAILLGNWSAMQLGGMPK